MSGALRPCLFAYVSSVVEGPEVMTEKEEPIWQWPSEGAPRAEGSCNVLASRKMYSRADTASGVKNLDLPL